MSRPLPRARIVRLGATPAGGRGREVPRRLRWALRLRAADVQIAWLLAVLGLGVCFAVVPRVDAAAGRLTARTRALVVQVTADEMHYVYAVGARSYQGVERLRDAPGPAPAGGLNSLFKVGEVVRVTYDPLAPARSTVHRFAGAIGRGSLWLLLWPGAAVAIALGALVLRRHDHRWQLRLLAHGEPATGQLVAREIAGDEVEVVVFTAGEPPAEVELPCPARRALDPDAVPVVFDPQAPDLALALDELPGYPRLTPERVALTAGVGAATFVLPVLTAIGAVVLAAISL